MISEKTERHFLRDHGLSLVTGVCFLLFLIGQSIAGYYMYNHDQKDHGEETITYPNYITTAEFGEATFENWESYRRDCSSSSAWRRLATQIASFPPDGRVRDAGGVVAAARVV